MNTVHFKLFETNKYIVRLNFFSPENNVFLSNVYMYSLILKKWNQIVSVK